MKEDVGGVRMNKPKRKIIVNNIEYIWTLNRFNGDGDGSIELKIWKDKKMVLFKFFAPAPKSITPHMIRNIIIKELI